MNVPELRAETPGCAHRVHLNNAGASLMPRPVVETILAHLELETSIGGYEAAADAVDRIADTYQDVAELLGTSPDRIAFTEHATASFAAALSAVPFESGDLIVTTRSDYVSNQIQYLSLAHRFGVEIARAPDDPEGGVDLQAMEELIHRRRPRLVAVTQIPSNSGLVQDVASIGTMCRARDILYLVDGCQSVGQMPVDVEAIGCDFFSATSRKYLRGPRGAGFLFVSAREIGALYFAYAGDVAYGGALAAAGRIKEALDWLRGGIAWFGRVGNRRATCMAALELARILIDTADRTHPPII